jgi:hypothetical protein
MELKDLLGKKVIFETDIYLEDTDEETTVEIKGVISFVDLYITDRYNECLCFNIRFSPLDEEYNKYTELLGKEWFEYFNDDYSIYNIKTIY